MSRTGMAAVLYVGTKWHKAASAPAYHAAKFPPEIQRVRKKINQREPTYNQQMLPICYCPVSYRACLLYCCCVHLFDLGRYSPSLILSIVPTCTFLSAPYHCPAAPWRQVGYQASGLTHPKTRPPGSDLCALSFDRA